MSENWEGYKLIQQTTSSGTNVPFKEVQYKGSSCTNYSNVFEICYAQQAGLGPFKVDGRLLNSLLLE